MLVCVIEVPILNFQQSCFQACLVKKKDKATFFSPTDELSLPAAYVVSRKDLNSAELLQPTAKCIQKKKRPCMSENWINS